MSGSIKLTLHLTRLYSRRQPNSMRGTRFAERESRAAWIASFLNQERSPGDGDILDATVNSISGNGERAELTQTLTYIGSVINSFISCELDVNRRMRQAWSAMNSLAKCVAVPILVPKDENLSLSLAGPSVLSVLL